MRSRQQPAFANPVLIGAVTVLVAIVAVFLAYNANNGLPFVPTRELKVDIPNGLICQSVDQATSRLQDAGFDVNVDDKRIPSPCPPGTVAATDPTGSTSKGGTVDLILANWQ